jgi:hypothetical protein
MNIAILGTGAVASAVGNATAAAGHATTLGSRNPAAAESTLTVLGHHEAIASAEVVINALPGSESLAVLTALSDALAGKTLLDIGNAVTPEMELMYLTGSLCEEIQKALPQTHVVKTLNTVPAALMANPVAGGVVFLSGNSTQAKKNAASLLNDLGWSSDAIVDLGDVTTARGPERYFTLFIGIAGATGSPMFNLALARP